MSEELDRVVDRGNCYYYKKGTKILHREDGPAVELGIHYRAWYIDGRLHRKDGPAVRIRNGSFSTDKWYLNGKEVTEEEVMGDNKDYQVGGDHYAKQDIQPWDYMEACMSEEEFKGYLRGNVIKYVSRYDKKGGLQDIDKAMHYLEKLRSLL